MLIKDLFVLNDCTDGDTYPLPRIDDLLSLVRNGKIFSFLDVCKGYWNFFIKTVFATLVI